MTEPERPDPDELLRRYGFVDRWSRRQRGRLRVYLGSAAGVGKTYAMLREGHRLRAEGHDVVVGFLETHGRPETAAQLGDLEVVPRRSVPYRGVLHEEMDTETIIARAPQIALVDELAHANVPGSPRAKRWQDVEALREAGIDVIATMNVQHLEGLRDVVAGITGVEVRETVPDTLLDDAEVQLIDLPVDQLIDRLEQGKVYPPHRARQALENYFRPGNLTALRELALRRTAAGVEEQLEGFMQEAAPEQVWQAAEKVLVQIDGDPKGAVVRNAWRLASALRCPLVGVVVAPPGGLDRLPADIAAVVRKNLLLAEDLGSSARVVESDDAAAALAAAAREAHATILVVGYAAGSRWDRLLRASLVDRLLDLLDGVDVYVVERPGRKR